MSKKILSVMLAIMLVLSAFSVSAFAAGADFEDIKEDEVLEYTQTWSLSEPEKVSDGVYSVDVSLTTNYVAGVISFRIDTENGAKATGFVVNEDVITFNYLQRNGEGIFIIVPEPANDTDEGIEIDGVIATLTYTLADGTDGDTLTLVNDAKTATNPGGDLFAARLSDGNLTTGTMICGQRVVDKNGDDIEDQAVIASVDIGEAKAEPQLVAADGYEDIVIDTNKTFGGAYAGTIYGFSGSSFRAATYLTTQLKAIDGTIATVQTPYNAVKTFGTGATVQLKNLDGEVVATYVVVIFGDVDCNGTITATDVQKMVNFNKGLTDIPANPIHLAAQLFCTNAGTGRALNSSDVQKMVNFNKGTETISQADLAAKHATFTDARNYGSSYVMAS